MRPFHACPIARPFESTSRASIACSRRRLAQGWARTVSPLSSPFRILASVHPRSILGCLDPLIKVIPTSQVHRPLAATDLAGEGQGCSFVLRPIEWPVRPPSSPSTPTSPVRTGDREGVRS